MTPWWRSNSWLTASSSCRSRQPRRQRRLNSWKSTWRNWSRSSRRSHALSTTTSWRRKQGRWPTRPPTPPRWAILLFPSWPHRSQRQDLLQGFMFYQGMELRKCDALYPECRCFQSFSLQLFGVRTFLSSSNRERIRVQSLNHWFLLTSFLL